MEATRQQLGEWVRMAREAGPEGREWAKGQIRRVAEESREWRTRQLATLALQHVGE
jgi:hypothetical protein